ncbi:MAG: leader peptidase (prepilin peptidase) / N-methyltransferase [Clostridia bacterium]|nr:leader peptidase (prepilin peptidase) / N-methyltransferase [Clostridia bacterium]
METLILIAVLGFTIGSFLGLCITRLSRGESIVFPPSHCDACGRRLGVGELIPLLGFILCRGRCPSCGTKVPWWYPGIEVLTAGLYIVLYLQNGPNLVTVKYIDLVSLLLVMSGIDLITYTIPDVLILIGIGLGLIFLPFGDISWQAALIGGFLGGGLPLLLAIVSRGGMGGGDVKLGFVLGLFLGWKQVLLALFLSALLGALFGLLLMTLGRKGLRDAIPFGPFMALGTIITVLWGEGIIEWYINLFF